MISRPFEKVKLLYERLQTGTLIPEDYIPQTAVTYEDHRSFIRTCRTNKSYFQETFGTFVETYDVFRIFADPTSIVLDVGAHTGYSAVAMRHNGCLAKIISFDAIAANVSALQELREVEGSSFDCFQIAISDRPGCLRLYLPIMNGHAVTALASTGATLTHAFEGYVAHFADLAAQFPSNHPTGEHEPRFAILDIEADTIDNVLARHGVAPNQVVAVKMDLEGHEAPALQGSAHLFTHQRPLLMIEGANRNEAVCHLMQEFGYFHCERMKGCLVPHADISLANDGFWVHPDRADTYKSLGLLCDAP